MNTMVSDLDRVIMENRNLIYSLSKQYNYNLRDDLFQVGALVMIDAYKNFRPDRNTKFSSYAYPYVEGAMKKFVRENRGLKVSRDLVYLASKIERVKELLRQKFKREPIVSEIASYLEMNESKIIEAMEINNYIGSIDEPINDDGRELTLKDVIKEEERYDKIDLISLRDELLKLTPKEKEIINRRYFEDRTQNETASLMGISQVDVSRSEQKIIHTLRNKLQ